MTSYCSVLTITAFTAERYIAICYPIKSQTLSNLSRAVKIIVVIWIIAALFALPYPIRTRTFYYVIHNGAHIEESLLCNIPSDWLPEMKYVFQLSTFVFFILPMAIISVMYILIGRSLSKSNFSSSGQVHTNYATKAKARTAVIKMLGKKNESWHNYFLLVQSEYLATKTILVLHYFILCSCYQGRATLSGDHS